MSDADLLKQVLSLGGVGGVAIWAMVALIRRHDAALEKRDQTFTAALEKKDAQILAMGERWERSAEGTREALGTVAGALDAIRADIGTRDNRNMDLAGKMVAGVEHVTEKLAKVEHGQAELRLGQAKLETAVEKVGGEVKGLSARVERVENKMGGDAKHD